MYSANGIQAILFDLDGTLRHYLPSGGEVFSDYVAALGLPISDEDRRRAAIWEHYYFANSPEIQADQKKFNGKEQKFWHNFAHRRLVALGVSPDLVFEFGSQVSEYMQENYVPEIWTPEETHDVLSELRESRFILGVVSNRDYPFIDHLEEMDLLGFFHFSLAAGEVQSWKPQSGIFEHAMTLAKSSPARTLYIGDNYFADVVGARQAGLIPVLYDRNDLFIEPDCDVISSFDDIFALLHEK